MRKYPVVRVTDLPDTDRGPAFGPFTVSIVSRDELDVCPAWSLAFPDQRKDHRYYEIVEDTIRGHFAYKYFAIRRPVLGCFTRAGYARIPSMPMTRLNIEYDSFESYLTRALKSSTRRKLRKNLEASANTKIEMSVVEDITPYVSEVYPLYLQVYHRSTMQFEKLTGEYFLQLSQRMHDKMKFFVWRRAGRAVAFSMCMIQGDSLYAEYVGLDYAVAIDLHLYHYIVRDMISWAMSRRFKWFRSTALNYDPKLHMRHELDPIDLYVRFTSPLANLALKHLVPLLGPVRSDKVLPKFANYRDLW